MNIAFAHRTRVEESELLVDRSPHLIGNHERQALIRVVVRGLAAGDAQAEATQGLRAVPDPGEGRGV